MDVSREQIYLAALLHDIGKFYERAEGSCKSEDDSVFKYSHARYTRDFYDNYAKSILSKFELNNAEGDKNLIHIAAKHHQPSTDAEKIITIADNFAAAVDRIGDANANKIAKGICERPLLSIFSRVEINDDFKTEDKYFSYYDVDKLSLKTDKIFPEKDKVNSKKAYKELWDEFIEEFKKLKTDNIHYFNETFLKLLEKYTAKIPSSAVSSQIPDITLFDHSKVTAAFAVAIYNYLTEKGKDINVFENTNVIDEINNTAISPFLLVGGDLSGIQSFIYDIKGKFAAKNLKGRSFYLHILTKTFLIKLFKKLNLFKANLIYGSGGTFYFIAQNTDNAKKIIDEFSKLFNKALFKIFGNKIYFSVSYVEFGKKEVDDKKIGDIWDKLISQNIEQKKNLKHLDLLDDLFTQKDPNGDEKDGITGDLLYNHNTKKLEDGKITKKINADLIKLGQKLRNSDYWIISDKILSNRFDNKYLFNPFYSKYFEKDQDTEEFEELNLYHYFIPKEEVKPLIDCEIIQFNNTDFIVENFGAKNIFSFEFYGGNKFPVYTEEDIKLSEKDNNLTTLTKKDIGEVKEFSFLAHGENFDRLGILRMDVDSLGQIFAEGFDFSKNENGVNQISFSRLATLSRSLDLFFSGYLNEIWNKEKYKDQTMIIYSGGDDLFIVGRWDLLIEMAYDIRKDFKKYTANNPNLSISGGIAIVTPKYPILKAANLSGDYESAAKNHTLVFLKGEIKEFNFNGKKYYYSKDKISIEKNSFNFLGHSFNWDIEFDTVYELHKKIYDFLKPVENEQGKQIERLPQSFIQRIYQLNEYRKKNEDTNKRQNWIWISLYYLKRMKDRQKHLKIQNFIGDTAETINKFNNEYIEKENSLFDWLDDISKNILKANVFEIPDYLSEEIKFAENPTHFMEILSLAARWAYLKNKTENK